MVTTTEGMLNGILGGTANLRPAIALHFVLVVVVAGLHHRLIHAATARGNADDSAARRRHGLPGAGRQPDAGLLAIV